MCTVTRPNLLADCQLSVVRPRKIGTNHPLKWMVVDLLKKCKKKKLSIGTQTLLLESFARSSAGDAKKLYDLEIKKLTKEKETSYGNN